MTKTEVKKLLELPLDERAELARQLLESLPAGPIPEWHLNVLEERLAEADGNPEAGLSWEEAEAELWPDS